MHVIILLLLIRSSVPLIINLGGKWNLEDDHKNLTSLMAEVPGGIYTDLFNNKIIDEPLFGTNDQITKWVGRTNWNYYRNFTVEQDFLNHSNINVVFEGLDTISTILINDKIIGNSTSMFVRYIFDVKDVLTPGINTIKVKFTSPVSAASEASKDSSYPVPPQCPPNKYQGECHVNQIRKMQASFSWDWGPSFASMGIWKNVSIEAYNSSVIRYVVTELQELEDDWNLKVNTYFSNQAQGKLFIALDTDYATINNIYNIDIKPNFDEIISSNSIVLPKISVKKWWPNGYGTQSLYRLKVKFEESEFIVKIGFRTVELVQDPINSTGNTFYFRVNGVPIFAKGSNSIPIHILPEKGGNVTVLRKLLETAKDNNMNMIRIWGGGVYESDLYYDLADEMGIMIWQDFMFACALYPTRSKFLSDVVEEVRHQVKRISRHPSVVLWTGNNENEAALASNWYGSNHKKIYDEDYKKLYLDTIKAEYKRIFPSGLFITSSPTNGVKSDRDGGFSPNPYNLLYGDDHCYIYELDSFNPNIYPITRFASEYGFQSYPSPSSILSVLNQTSLNVRDDYFENRQHHPLGNAQILLLTFYQFKLPPKNSINYTSTFIFYSQIVQAMSVKIETEHYRKYRSYVTSDGKGMTMGALYWQLNDVWVAPSWSGIDFTGKHKMLQYYVKDVFAPIIVVGHLDVTRRLNVYVISDKLYDIDDVDLLIQVFRWDSFVPLKVIKKNLHLERSASNLVLTLNTDELLSQLGCGDLKSSRKNCFFYLQLTRNGAMIAPNNFALVDKIKNSSLLNATMEVSSVVGVDGKTFEIEISSTSIAIFVWLETTIGGKFSENGFLLVNPRKKVVFISDEKVDVGKLRQDLRISHLLTNNLK